MPLDQKRCHAVCLNLNRQLRKLLKHARPETVHKVRTDTRRVETVIENLVPEKNHATKKLLKSLRGLRRRSGKVRDLDVQILALQNLKMADQGGQKTQLTRALASERDKKVERLVGLIDNGAAQQLRKKLKRACSELAIPEGMEPLTLALNGFTEIGRDRTPLTQKTVHRYRIAGKRARYLLELADEDSGTEAVINTLKKMQDVVGEWHDWLTLTERAEKLFGGVKESALVAALRNLTRAKYRESVNEIIQTRAAVDREKLVLRHKPPGATHPIKHTQSKSTAA